MSPQKDRRKLFQQVGVQFQEANYPDKIRVTSCVKRQPVSTPPLPITENCCSSSAFGKKETNFVSELSGGQKQRLL